MTSETEERRRVKATWLLSLPSLARCSHSPWANISTTGLANELVVNAVLTLDDVSKIEACAKTHAAKVDALFENHILPQVSNNWPIFLAAVEQLDSYSSLHASLEQNADSIGDLPEGEVNFYGSRPVFGPASRPVFFSRPDDEVALKIKVSNLLLESDLAGVLNVRGEDGIGKTSLVAQTIAGDEFFLKTHGVASVLWLSGDQLSQSNKQAMPLRLFDLLASTINRNNGKFLFDKLRQYFASLLPRKCLIILDDMNHPYKLRLSIDIAHLLGDNIRFVVISRRGVDGARIPNLRIQAIDPDLFQAALTIPDPELLLSCRGLPLCALVLHAVVNSEGEPMKRVQTKLVEQAKSENNFVLWLLQDEDFHYSVTSKLLPFMVFDKGTRVKAEELFLLWQSSDMEEANSHLGKLSAMGLVTEFSDRSFELTPLVRSSLVKLSKQKGQQVDQMKAEIILGTEQHSQNALELAVRFKNEPLLESVVTSSLVDHLCLRPGVLAALCEFSLEHLCQCAEKLLSTDYKQGLRILKQESVFHVLLDKSTVQTVQPWQSNPFLISIMRDFFCLREAILRSGVDLTQVAEVRTDEGFNAVMLATKRSDLAAVKRLLAEPVFSKLANVCTDDGGLDPLMLASQQGDCGIVRGILEHCSDLSQLIRQVDDFGNSAVMLAVRHNRAKVLELLLAVDAVQVNLKNKNGESAIWLAVVQGFSDCCEILFRNNTVLSLGEAQILLVWMRSRQLSKIENLIVEWNPDIPPGETFNAREVKAAVLRLLVTGESRGLDDQVLEAVINGNFEELDPSPSWRPSVASQYALIAALFGHDIVLKVLLAECPNLEVDDCRYFKNGSTPLYLAAACGHENCVAALISHGADVNKVNDDKRTALMIAAANGHAAVIRLLLENGADSMQRDKNGIVALYIACHHGNLDVVKLLVEKDGKKGVARATKWNGFTALMAAAKQGHDDVVAFLLDNGAALDAETCHGVTPIDVTLWEERATTLDMLSKAARDDLAQTMAKAREKSSPRGATETKTACFKCCSIL